MIPRPLWNLCWKHNSQFFLKFFSLHKDEVESDLPCYDLHCHACGECLQPGDECITTSDFSKNDEDVDYGEECFELLSQAQDRCHLGTILFESDCFLLC